MKNRIVLVALLALVFIGCEKSGQERYDPAVKEGGAGKDQAQQQPYYYGLIEEYLSVLEQEPQNRAVTIALANAYYDSGNWKQAIIYYERALRMQPDDPDIVTDLGTCYRNIGMPDRAIENYRRALQYSPSHLNARYNLGIVYGQDKKDYAMAIREWEELLRIAPTFHHAAVMRETMKSFKRKLSAGGGK